MRSRVFNRISEDTFDVIVIGAGINGAGIARDAAMRGVKVLLLDKSDIGAGTSSASTRLIHGGLRYLEHGEVGLVRESLRERGILFRIAPHLVKPLPLLIPIYKGRSRGQLKIRAGMFAYDLLSYDKLLPGHEMLTWTEILRREPGLNPRYLRGGALYFDGHVEFAERLVLENALSSLEHGATVLTYAKVQRLLIENARVGGVEVKDLFTNEVRTARAPVVVNAAGPWVDQLLAGTNSRQRLIGGTKGSHIVVPPFAGAPETALYVEAAADGRPFFIIPWNENYLIGTTDIGFDGDLDRVKIDAAETSYLLKETNQLFPEADLKSDSICFSYSGVRPLAYSEGKDGPSITRRHFVIEHDVAGLISIVGGKLTTYRSLAEETVDLVGRRLKRKLPPCATAETPLPGAASVDFEKFKRRFMRESPLWSSSSERLLRIYGARAEEVLKLIEADSSLGEVVDVESGATAAEVVLSFEHELAETLEDCMLRRTMLGLNCRRGLDALEAVGRILHERLGWSSERIDREVELYRNAIGLG